MGSVIHPAYHDALGQFGTGLSRFRDYTLQKWTSLVLKNEQHP